MVLVNSCHAIRKIRTTLNARIRSRIRIFRYICKTLFTINLSRHANGSPRQSQNQADKIPLSAARTHPRSAVVNRIHKLHDDRQRVGRHPLQEMVVGRQPVRRRARHVQRLGVVQPHHAKDLRIPDLRPAQNLRTVPRQRQGRLGIHDGSPTGSTRTRPRPYSPNTARPSGRSKTVTSAPASTRHTVRVPTSIRRTT